MGGYLSVGRTMPRLSLDILEEARLSAERSASTVLFRCLHTQGRIARPSLGSLCPQRCGWLVIATAMWRWSALIYSQVLAGASGPVC